MPKPTKMFNVISMLVDEMFKYSSMSIELFGTDDTELFEEIYNQCLGDTSRNYRFSSKKKSSIIKQYIRRYVNKYKDISFVEIMVAKSFDGIDMLYLIRGINTMYSNIDEIKHEIKSQLSEGKHYYKDKK